MLKIISERKITLKDTRNTFFVDFHVVFHKWESEHTTGRRRKSKDTWSPITYYRGDNSDGVHRGARAFIRGRTHFLLMYRRLAAISYARRNGFEEPVIGHLWRTVPNRCVDRQGAIATFHEFVAIHLRAGIASSQCAKRIDPDPVERKYVEAKKGRVSKYNHRLWVPKLRC